MPTTMSWTRRAAVIAMGVLMAAAVASPARVALADGNKGGGGNDTTSAPEDPAYTKAVDAIKRNDFATAIPLLEGVVAKNDRNADAYNWLAYSIRQQGDAARAVPIYQKALAIDPKHRGAHEYLGEAYLVLGDLPKAKEQLAALDKLCFFPCEEYTDLKKAVAAYESSGGRVKPVSKGQ